MTPRRWAAWSLSIAALLALAACASWVADVQVEPTAQRFENPYVVTEDTGERVPGTYFLRRAWVQITRDLAKTEVPPTVPLDLQAMAQRPFAVSWLGHSAMLMRVGGLWVLFDPVLTDTAGPVAGFGPARLTALPVVLKNLPRIDVVLTSHDHWVRARVHRRRAGCVACASERTLGPATAFRLDGRKSPVEKDYRPPSATGRARVLSVRLRAREARSEQLLGETGRPP